MPIGDRTGEGVRPRGENETAWAEPFTQVSATNFVIQRAGTSRVSPPPPYALESSGRHVVHSPASLRMGPDRL